MNIDDISRTIDGACTGFDTTHAFLLELCSYEEPVQEYYCWLRGKR